MNLMPEIIQQLDRHLDEGASLPQETQTLLLTSEEYQRYFEERKKLLNILGDLPPVEAPADFADGVMAFIERRESETAAKTIAAPPSTYSWRDALQPLKESLSIFHLPQVVRREAWALGLSVIAILWGTLISPQVQSGQAQAYLAPMAQEVIAFADSLQARSLQLSDQLAILANDLITPDAISPSDNNPLGNGRDSGTSLRPKPIRYHAVLARFEVYTLEPYRAHC